MSKKQNRKKQLKHQLARLRKAGSAVAGTVAETAKKTAGTVVEGAKEVVADVKKELQPDDFDSFAAELEGVAQARLETFYEEGIKSAKDFAKWTEKELLALKGIGPATIKQLKELGIKLKK